MTPARKAAGLAIALLVATGCGGAGTTSSPTGRRATPRPVAAPSGTFIPLGTGDLVFLDAQWVAYGPLVEVFWAVENDGPEPVRFEPRIPFYLVGSIGTSKSGEVVATAPITPLEPELAPGQKTWLGGWVEGVTAEDMAELTIMAPIAFQGAPSATHAMTLKAPMAQVDEGSDRLVVRGLVSWINPDVESSGVICVVLLDSDMKPVGWLQDDHTLPGVVGGQGDVFTADEPKLSASLLPSVFVSQAGACNP